jgi:hypothetical protein
VTVGYGFLVVRRGVPAAHEAMRVGDAVETYQLLDPLPITRPVAVPPLVPWDAHAEARRLAPAVRSLAKSKEWRTGHTHGCLCKHPRASLATELVAPNGQRWVLVNRPESIPTSFRRAEHTDEPTAWPLHSEPTGAMPPVSTHMVRCPDHERRSLAPSPANLWWACRSLVTWRATR